MEIPAHKLYATPKTQNVGPGRIATQPQRRRAIPDKYRATRVDRRGVEYRYWKLKASAMRDQGPSSTCVGHGFFHNAWARPKVVKPALPITPRMIYDIAQGRDYWDGSENDPDPAKRYEGTSVMAGAEASVELGLLKRFEWPEGDAEKIAEIAISWILTKNPIVIGVDWPLTMMMPLPTGFLDITGRRDGSGHCVLVDGCSIKHGHVEGPNSWGLDWGPIRGRFKLTIPDLVQLIRWNGEVCLPVE
jgi:hypothetical protein